MRKTVLCRVGLMGVCVVLLSGGCALTTDYANVAYEPQSSASTIPGASNVKVKLVVTDSRSNKEKVSAKINGFGSEMAAILTKQDVAVVLSDAIAKELRMRGFRIAGGDASLYITLKKFYNQFKAGMWSGSSIATLDMNVMLKKNGLVKYKNDIAVETTRKIMVANGANAAETLNTVLRKAVERLMDDQTFIDALLKSSEPKKTTKIEQESLF